MDQGCAVCSGPLIKPLRGPTPTYCGNSCKVAARVKADRATGRTRQLWSRVNLLDCTVCRQVFVARTSVAKVCKRAECRRAFNAKRMREKYRSLVRANSSLRRARIRSLPVEAFTHEEIFERDEWLCGLCDSPVDPALRHPEPMSPSLDHIVPISRGGPHLRSNVQCSHLVCNLRKNARLRVASK